ncbi:VWA domain-containing protein [Arhodomonas aquaeolei]|uniref:vWA domain-containing protein n=1 Tax=Arhodomonas aquaeolei TaxID=2369 RepID=UPI0021684E24|nr:VWA domain-containing protein [Arhodomonas aquaeolei]MCS4503718.1 VWA domain-containing protein [Arhodomonas aquaeolei]
MLISFLQALREAGLRVSVTEFLTLLEALQARVTPGSVEDFYFLARACLVKDETRFDRFDQVFSAWFSGVEDIASVLGADIPEEWLRRQAELSLSEAEKAELEGMGWDELMRTLRERLAEQSERHQGGNKWIGTAGRSPYGAWGYNPEGVRIGQDRSRHRRAVKVWDQRTFRNLDGDQALESRNLKLALRRLRRFAREGAGEELDLDDTISATARRGGQLDLRMVPERHNAARVLVFFDIGGSMDDHVAICEALFSAARSEFKHLTYYYFHNCPYETLWRDATRRHADAVPTHEVLHTFDPDYRVIIVGDAAMSPYEVKLPGAGVEHWNEESGETWLRRIVDTFPHLVWLNPEPSRFWDATQSNTMIREVIGERMYPLTPDGLEAAMQALNR